MKILAFDTSNNCVSVALAEDNNILYQIEDLTPSKQAETLVLIIEEILSKNGIYYEDIDYLAVINGPGSFTGIRVGLACAKAILLGNTIENDSGNIKSDKKEVYKEIKDFPKTTTETVKSLAYSTVTNFEIYKYNAIRQVSDWDKIIVLINAYRGQLYIKIFDKLEDMGNDYSEPLLLDYQDTQKLIKKLASTTDKIFCVGNGLHLIYEQLNEIRNLNIYPRFSRIRAMHICKYIAQSYDLSNHKTRKSLPIEPLYIRLPDAKIKLQ